MYGRTIRIGCGAGFAGDRIEPAVELAERGGLDYLAFECLAERTIALAQQARQHDAESGFDPLLIARFKAVLPAARRNRVKIITNMGAANPAAAARAVAGVARGLGLSGLKIAYVLGDDVLHLLTGSDRPLIERNGLVSDLADRMVSANAYLGVEPVVEALRGGADIVITGRVADPALFMAPLVHEFGWGMTDWPVLGRATVTGHLLECAAQVSGGYFADPGYKDVADIARIGFPLADVWADGSSLISKVDGSGGEVSVRTCKEQLLYEVHDPAAYIQPDVVADFSGVRFVQDGTNRVRVTGGSGRPRTDTLKVTIGYRDSFIGEGQISYAGTGAAARGQLALDIVRERLKIIGLAASETRFDLIGVNAVRRGAGSGCEVAAEPAEVRARVTARTATMDDALRIGHEVESLWLNGPAGGGGAWKSAREVIAAASTLLPRALVKTSVHYEVVR